MQRKLLPSARDLLVIGTSTAAGGRAELVQEHGAALSAHVGDGGFQHLLAEPRMDPGVSDPGASGGAEPRVGGGLSPAESLGHFTTGQKSGPRLRAPSLGLTSGHLWPMASIWLPGTGRPPCLAREVSCLRVSTEPWAGGMGTAFISFPNPTLNELTSHVQCSRPQSEAAGGAAERLDVPWRGCNRTARPARTP